MTSIFYHLTDTMHSFTWEAAEHGCPTSPWQYDSIYKLCMRIVQARCNYGDASFHQQLIGCLRGAERWNAPWQLVKLIFCTDVDGFVHSKPVKFLIGKGAWQGRRSGHSGRCDNHQYKFAMFEVYVPKMDNGWLWSGVCNDMPFVSVGWVQRASTVPMLSSDPGGRHHNEQCLFCLSECLQVVRGCSWW